MVVAGRWVAEVGPEVAVLLATRSRTAVLAPEYRPHDLGDGRVAYSALALGAARELSEMVRPDLEGRGLEVHVVSAVAHTGLKELTFALARHVRQAREDLPIVEPPRQVLRPRSVDDSGFRIVREEGLQERKPQQHVAVLWSETN